MTLLYFFEQLRTPVLNFFAGFITFFGSETFFLLALLLIYWCINKKVGYRMMFAFIAANSVTQMLKIIFRVPRPWVRDPDFTIVEQVRKSATGYSFPSGHTSLAVTFFGTLFLNLKVTWIRILAVVLALLVPISRMYLGVHTLLDVGVAFVLALFLVILVDRIIESYDFDPRSFFRIMMILQLIPVVLLILSLSLYYNDLIDYENMVDAIKSSGVVSGMLVGWYLESTRIKFSVRCDRLWKQLVKFIIGLACIMALRYGLKYLFALIPDFWPGDFIRYASMGIFATGVYPLAIKRFFEPGEKD